MRQTSLALGWHACLRLYYRVDNFCSWSYLVLLLRGDSLAVPQLPSLAALCDLEQLTASSNQLEGSLEGAQLGKLTSLKRLFFNGNKIAELPLQELRALVEAGAPLEKLNFANNALALPLPDELAEEFGDILIV